MEISNTFLNALRSGSKSLSVVAEFYQGDAKPGASYGFDPASDDFLFAVAATNLSFCGRDYLRLIPEGGIGEIDRVLDKTLSGFSLSLVNENNFVADFEKNVSFEGLVCVARVIDRQTSANLNDSHVLFTGVAEPAGDYSRSSNAFKVNVLQTLNQTEILAPRRTFSTEDPIGRAQSDYLFQGFIFEQRTGVNVVPEKVASTSFFGRLFGRKKTIQATKPFSSHTTDLEDTAVPLVVGRTQAEAIIGVYIDRGTWIEFVAFFADGHEYGIKTIENVRSVTAGMTLAEVAVKTGKQGGAVDDANHQAADDPSFVGNDEYSETAYIRAIGKGTTLESDDAAPRTVGLCFGQIVPKPDSDGEFTLLDVSDNPAALLRWFLSSPGYFNLSSEWHDDDENLISYDYNNHFLIDQTNTDAVLLPDGQQTYFGTQYQINKSTAVVTPKYVKNLLGTVSAEEALAVAAEPIYYDEPPINSDDPGTGTPVAPPTQIRRRYTLNGQIRKQTSAYEFLHDYWLAAANMYLAQQPSGKFAFKNRKPEDWSFFYDNASANAAEILVKNINPFAAKPGLILIGANLSNAEVREITGYRYKTDVSMTVAASGGVSSSGGSLTGGSDTVAPNVTLTVSSASGTKNLTVAGFPLSYSPQSGETTTTAAFMLAASINSHNELNKFIKGTWNGDNTLKVSSRIGYLELNEALEFAHLKAIADPSAAVSLSEISAGNLPAGKYYYCYSYVTAEGETLASPWTEITIAANKNIGVPVIAKPARVLQINHYISIEPGGVRPKLVKENDGSAFTIDRLPTATDRMPPITNATSEMIHRIAMVFADQGSVRTQKTRSNILKDTFALPRVSSDINQIEITYFDAANDYKETTLKVNDKRKQKKARKINKLEIKGAFIDNRHQAHRIANQKLNELSAPFDYEFTSDNEALTLQEAAVVCVTDLTVGYINKPVSINKISISPNGYPSVKLRGRPYRKEDFDDQPSERLVPVQIVQNNAVNREHIAPVIYRSGDATNDSIPIRITNYSGVPYYRKIEVSTDNDFTVPANITITIETGENQFNNVPGENFNILRAVPGTAALTVYIRISHSSNGVTWGAVSNVVMATFADSTGAGGSGTEPTPEPGTSTGTGDAPPPAPSPGGCFLAGTLILMADGSLKKIEEIAVHDFVKAFHERTGQLTERRVKELYPSAAGEYYELTFADGAEISVTPRHRFWTLKGWRTAAKLRTGSKVVDEDGLEVKVLTKKKITKDVKVYNFQVERDQTYIVLGAKGQVTGKRVSNLKPAPTESVL